MSAFGPPIGHALGRAALRPLLFMSELDHRIRIFPTLARGIFRYRTLRDASNTGRMTSTRLARGRRSEIGRVYSITTVVRDREPIFLDAALAAIVIDELRQLSAHGHVQHFAWVLMPEHLHWLFALRRSELGYCVQLLKGRCARAINITRCGSGSVWQPGYFDHALRSDEAVRTHARYLIANPLRAGLVEEINDYPYQWCAWDIDVL